jgi:hypothetical protein
MGMAAVLTATLALLLLLLLLLLLVVLGSIDVFFLEEELLVFLPSQQSPTLPVRMLSATPDATSFLHTDSTA